MGVDDLTPRERDVLRALALGRSNRDIAATLEIGEETVKTHVGNLLGTLGVANRAQAIVQALKRGLVSLDDLE
jgi:DNA-binding NarL/FixJ family response regulator